MIPVYLKRRTWRLAAAQYGRWSQVVVGFVLISCVDQYGRASLVGFKEMHAAEKLGAEIVSRAVRQSGVKSSRTRTEQKSKDISSIIGCD